MPKDGQFHIYLLHIEFYFLIDFCSTQLEPLCVQVMLRNET